ncbi:MAG: HAD-IIB family hydrolase [Methylomonas sp.]|jgi:hypothetical protein|uniref:HAD-IIB family hydrolase n=1 Tax=Methylomonas sp. TaxID=418 RepID=UPI0025EDB15F|nr:HAD-IIB family hydrolase [Methylomonas sp.]MCK9607315.1 HAD-IIB family hydrolase [Methylomonas sp.]
MTERILICTDLDRTLLPNGSALESPRARPLFKRLVARPEILLAYVSGRHKALVKEAIVEYDLPSPDFVIGDVGTTLYDINRNDWLASEAWAAEIAPDWAGYDHQRLQTLLAGFAGLTPQEAAKQNRFKLSYYLPMDMNTEQLLLDMQTLLRANGIRAELIYSIDEAERVGLLDVLPASATKFHAVEFLMKQLGIDVAHSVFAGDSGNDLPVMASAVQAVLVANASPEVRQEAQTLAKQQGNEATLYQAKGQFLGMNGNYAAGILEGVAHYLPHTLDWMHANE